MKPETRLHELFYKKLKSTRAYECKICGCIHHQFNDRLLQKCNTTRDEYIKVFGYPNKFYEKDDMLKKLTNKFNDLYIDNRYKWLILSGYYHGYVTKNTSEIKKNNANNTNSFKEIEYLTDYQVHCHFKGKDTLGVFPVSTMSKFLVFDIDSYSGIHVAQGIATEIKNFLSLSIPSNQIHIIYSGKKGYHITLYFCEHLEITDLFKLFATTINNIVLDDFDNFAIEMRPTLKGVNGLGIKLPHGVNFNSSDNLNNYSHYVNNEFKEVSSPINYILNIQTINIDLVHSLLTDYDSPDYDITSETYSVGNIPNNEHSDLLLGYETNNSPYYDFGGIEYIMNNGLYEPGTRHKWSFLIAMYLKEKNFDSDEAYDILSAWSLEQIERGYSLSSISDIQKDLHNIMFKGVYSGKRNYSLPIPYDPHGEIYLYASDFENIELLNKEAKETGCKLLNAQRVYFALLVHAQILGTRDDEFEMRYKDIFYISGIRSKKTVKKCLAQLEQRKIIEIIRSNAPYNPIIKCKPPNIYKLALDSRDACAVFSFPVYEIQQSDCFYRILMRMYPDKLMKLVFTESVIRRLKKTIMSNGNQ